MNYQPIRSLPDQVVKKIAAGEVIERPASIVKELMENSVDAMSTKIDVIVTNGGLSSITVQDNGIGIAQEDLPLTVEKNATSKIQSDEDLMNLETLGFRGEALSSISTVSQFQLQTKQKENSLGYELKVEGGIAFPVAPTGTVNGTRIQVSHLFYNTPVRKKFLRSKTTEFGHIEKTFKKIALAHPEIQFRLEKDGKTVYNLITCETFEKRIEQLYPERSKSLVFFEDKRSDVSVLGWVSNTHETYSGSQEVWIFLNGRWIWDRALQKAVMEGYRSALMEHRYPMCFLYIDMNPAQVDVNVHPTKAEVRFQKPQELFSLLAHEISKALKKEPAFHTVHPKQLAVETSFLPRISQPYPTYRPPYSEASEATENVSARPVEHKKTGFFANLEFLGSLDHTYILCRSSDTLVIIDQHAAHERVLFEQFKKKEASSLIQQLLVPIHIELSPSQSEKINELLPTFTGIGFDMEPFGENTWIIRSLPLNLKQEHCNRIVLEIVENSMNDLQEKSWDNIEDHRISTMACHSAVRAHDVLSFDEIHYLLQEMDSIDLASYCPHGRPTFLKLGIEHLESLFKRT